MGIVEEIKKGASINGTKIQTSDATQLEKIFNKMFYTDHNIYEETKFINQVMTRGLESQERIGLHASAIIVGEKTWCTRQQVLSLLFKQIQKENVNIGLLRIFEEGNAIHEKWQRLLIRSGYGKAKTMDKTRFNDRYELSYTPDIVCRIPEFFDGVMVGEIKSVNTFQFKKMQSHPSAKKQLQLYMYLCIEEAKLKGNWNGIDYTKGFVLCDDKNTQDFKLFIYDFDEEFVSPFIDRLNDVKRHKEIFLNNGKMVGRCAQCDSVECKMAQGCPMRNACWNVGFGRIKL
jgi:CRISPR/Cas system-associated exonuclease Cas4 (RecB family)